MASLVFPGDQIHFDESKSINIGPGLYCDPKTQKVLPVNAGIEVVSDNRKNESVYIDYDCKRYVPAVGDLVIGTIVGQFTDSYKVSLSNFSSTVTLSYMAFPNASKKNRPTLKVGDLVYAKVSAAEKELEAELECVDSATGKDAGFGLLDGGMILDITLRFARLLLFEEGFPLLPLLAKHTQFEIAIGVNGKIWVKCEELKDTLACYRSILDCQNAPTSSYKSIVGKIFGELARFAEA
ncbi:RRP40 (YOL142W) [Zygosaccharomyces parabailii]|uniref:BN860_04478g1_1 n=1 Tax=Zygosaccharomyces bailii (strain CLIB 213 / ATCC 58445 / CBS 680 / BCRC 21525 / NBRC 1098 / NCYC 1416 / NRRL Y-2227) TaxID=1333698 RepID=A0A8J2T1U8_ZYGB2|nr:RRP40 (YOL142W) [Zygosaccharomyces parabailii]CDF87353.1 BN860_04478g1_1 [Zygosaccharomyces bailii CLIB 213]CDH15580.1 probable Exosome complex component RRP40 [Zygosaccharomyces bailii ISA1307]SJM84969.1 probable Exosome complex component RRP40 [Zygosaccharomyces bailii]